MDYFAKFKNRIAPPKVQPTSAMQLAKFHDCWEYVHGIFETDDRKSNMHVQQTEIPAKLRQMVDLLVDEEARQEDNTPGVCMEHIIKYNILQYIVNVAERADFPIGFRGEAIRLIASMVDLLDDRFLVHNAVHKPTIKLLRFCVLDDHQSELYSDDLVDLMYIICSKIHGFPALLNIFFHDKHWLTTPQKNIDIENEQQKQPEYEFLLFTYLLRFVHREGRSGDFARTGLLFLMEMAVDGLGDFILGSDFSTIMAAGLGALYSQLPRKLIVKDEEDTIQSNPTTFILGENATDTHPSLQFPLGIGMQYSSSAEFKFQLDSFLKLLEFCQDVLMRCPNGDICMGLLNSVRTIFLENILYPSILECSDTDGSSVAVISYIDLILQTVQQNDLSRIVVGYLMDEEDDATEKSHTADVSHFTLKDLIFSRLESNSQTAVIATLRLLKTLINHHCRYGLRLLSVYPESKKPTTVSHHLREVELYFSLILAIDATHAKDILSHGYEDYLRDLEVTIDRDGCYQHTKQSDNCGRVEQATMKARRRRSFKYGQRYEDTDHDCQPSLVTQRPLFRHRIRSSDRLLQILLSLLSHFFTQSTELNLALTGVVTSLALCPYRSLEGWISFSESDQTSPDDVLVFNPEAEPTLTPKIRSQDIYAHFESTPPVDEDDDEDDRSIDFGAERESAKVTRPTFFKSYPTFFTLLRTLTQQVGYYRSEIPTFETMLEDRRKALITGEVSFIDRKKTRHAPPPQPVAPSARRPSVLRVPVLADTPALTPSSSSTSTLGPAQIDMGAVMNNPASPLALHIRKTTAMRIQPLFPSHFVNERDEPILDLDDEDEHTFAPKTGVDPSKAKKSHDKSTEITIHMLLNNVVILEESIKELVALIQVRRSLGVDEVAYV
ncbi:Retinoic acid induced 16-like protein-domain-containing protein [Sporodiniella umbellata]|nr:Retinoic acid induced 16-like protein-domain-containing protein [Sporodiniella umbellata]